MDIKKYGFEYRIADVIPMLDEKHLWGTMSLIRDLKSVVDEIEKIKNQAIDEFAHRIRSKVMAEIDDCADELDWIDEIAEQMKAGGV